MRVFSMWETYFTGFRAVPRVPPYPVPFVHPETGLRESVTVIPEPLPDSLKQDSLGWFDGFYVWIYAFDVDTTCLPPGTRRSGSGWW